MAAREAREGDRVVHVSCCDAGPVLVLESMRPAWTCGRCRGSGVDGGVVVLGPGGALPVGERVG